MLFVPAAPAIIIPAPPKLVRPGDPNFVIPALHQFVFISGGGGPSWQTVLTKTHTSESGSYSGYTVAITIPHSLFAAYNGTPSKLRAELQGGSSEGYAFTKGYVGHKAGAGDAWDAASLTALSFSTNPGGTAPVRPSVLVTDELTFAYDGASGLVFKFYGNTSTDTFSETSHTSATKTYFGPVDSAATANDTGGTSQGDTLILISKIEFFA